MYLARVTFALILFAYAWLVPTARPDARSLESPIGFSPAVAPPPTRSGRRLPSPSPSSSLSSTLSPDEASPLENEFEIPDEPEEDEPYDFGDAIRNRATHPSPPSIAQVSSFDTPITPGRAPAGPSPASAEDRPRFLSFCRLLI